MYNHNKAQQSKNRVHISWDILYAISHHIQSRYNGTPLYMYKPEIYMASTEK